MKDLIENTHSERLIAAMTSNMAAFWSPYGRVQGNILRESSKVVWFYTGIPAAILNGVLFARMETQDVQAVIVDLAAEIEAAGAPALWWLAPDSKPENLSELLESDGLQYAGTAPGMAVDLVSMDEGLNYIPNFQIHEVKDRKGQALWAQVVWIGMGFPEHMAEVYVHLESRLDDPQYQAQRRYMHWFLIQVWRGSML
jgi:hypothetical protein